MTFFRRTAALLAVLALAYATGFAALAHAAGMPMTTTAGITAMAHDHAGMTHETMSHEALDRGAIDHGTADHAVVKHDLAEADMPVPPCESGCALCKDCALCLFTGLPAMPLWSATLPYADYDPLTAVLRSGIRTDLPAEPPRV
jgi:hypothetical protein